MSASSSDPPTSTSAASDIEFEKPIFDGTTFANPKSFVNWTGLPNFLNVLKYKFIEKDHSAVPKTKEVLDDLLPVMKPNYTTGSSLSATWLGHATMLVQLDGIAFITDPVWSARASPVGFIGPFRYRPPPSSIEDLPELAFGVISHNHYDHLSESAVRSLSERFPKMTWFVPMGLKPWMEKHTNGNDVFEMTWGEKHTAQWNGKSFDIWCIPAQHWSMRGLFDRNKSLWSGWAVVGPTKRFYYTGDTGFCANEFRKLGQKLGPFDLAAIPIGCYKPSWFMSPQHIGPTEAVEVHKLVRAKKSVGIQGGTYSMGSYEHYLEPKTLLREIVQAQGVSVDDFFTLHHGETWSVDGNSTSSE
ncbi:Protein NAPE-2 a [Aphelenchoides avenae]|nr:Protein NAPE-2 a [Aphelenchus avenae]